MIAVKQGGFIPVLLQEKLYQGFRLGETGTSLYYTLLAILPAITKNLYV